ncbi:MAG: ABC transporter ATP-binding protein [Alphaproteobacteria bacterium]|nr:ABC transporter ATP-binding protein [Alphaproteobacteria bacterium]
MQITLQNFTKTFDDVTVIEDMNLEVKDGEMLALLGPSGCGKSTTLFAICGIHRVNGGKILFGDSDVSDLPSQKRNVGVVFQSYALYPHMNAYENIAFPLKVRKDKPADIKRQVHEIAKLTHIEELLERKPGQLSGGQQQRVALARALVRKPDILLLDEPLANLDAKLRLEMRAEIRRIQLETGITAILVTHDQVEAMSMCDRIALMHDGKIVQLDKPSEMYDNPANKFVADFLGNPPITFLDAKHQGDLLVLPNGHEIKNTKLNAAIEMLQIGIRPECFGPQFGTGIKGVVKFIEKQGREELFDIELTDGSQLRSIQSSGSNLSIGDDIDWGLALDDLLLFDMQGDRL